MTYTGSPWIVGRDIQQDCQLQVSIWLLKLKENFIAEYAAVLYSDDWFSLQQSILIAIVPQTEGRNDPQNQLDCVCKVHKMWFRALSNRTQAYASWICKLKGRLTGDDKLLRIQGTVELWDHVVIRSNSYSMIIIHFSCPIHDYQASIVSWTQIMIDQRRFKRRNFPRFQCANHAQYNRPKTLTTT